MHIAIIPTMEMDRCLDLVYSINKGKIKPSRIIIINNSGSVYTKDLSLYNTIVCNYSKNIGVNAAWNIGLKLAKEQSSHLSILNDDILIKEDFFKRINLLLSIRLLLDVPVFCPSTTHDKTLFDRSEVNNHTSRTHYMRKKEGWAFTIRDRFVKMIKPIPEELFVFCGDDWIWNETVKYGTMWVKDERNIIYHTVGATLKNNPKLRALLKHEKRIFHGKGKSWKA
ncbi:MAG: hypothetical protein PVG39_00285 [Desulfobacteraceae bacterium]|jgi:GT2 family glycosyltransferase